MGKSKSEVRKRQKMIGVRVTNDEYASLVILALAAKRSVPDYLRRAALSPGTQYK